MTKFGKQLREFRQQCNDKKSPHGRLTQEKFAELVGQDLGISYSGAAVSDWERGVSKIHADQRKVLISMINVLHQQGGIKTPLEANQLLDAGNYRALNPAESKEIFQESAADLEAQQSHTECTENKSMLLNLMGMLFFDSPQEFRVMLATAQDGPPPAWPRVMVATYRKFAEHISVSNILTFILWVWVWLLAWALISPSLRWPFSNQNEAFSAVVIYAGGAIVIPAIAGALTNTKHNEFWQKQLISELNLRLYTHQGASIGFHVGYFFIFMIGLLRYNLGLPSITWMDLLAAAFPVVLAYASARLVPRNLLLAYKSLSLRNGAIFFIFFLFSPAWAYFLLNSYDVLLTKALGIFTVLMALTILLAMMALRYRQSGTTVIPTSWWVVFFGSIVICQLLALLIR